jgi:hypothetical protein
MQTVRAAAAGCCAAVYVRACCEVGDARALLWVALLYQRTMGCCKTL